MDVISEIKTYFEHFGDWLLTSGLKIALILFLLLIFTKVADILSGKLAQFLDKKVDDYELQKRADTLSSIIRYTLKITIFIVAAMMVLQELGVNIGPVLAAAGVLGLAVGFGAQKLVEDVISGFFILLEDQIRVGDVIQVGDKGGLVEKITLRMIILRDLAGNVHYIRNSQINVVTNMTKEYSRYVFDIGVAYREDPDEVIEVIKAVDESLRKDENFKFDILEPIEILGLDKFGDSAIVIKARTKTKPIKQWSVAREFNKRLKKAFDEKGIEIPFPHRTIYFGVDKSGNAPAMNINSTSRTNEHGKK
ncbi:MAG: mechanosensitive ion channel family protein [Candidatus Omnitrophica bacterium]|nr:mechanosensitive ion channel family protein [Candidatus Omnitrophota bacterium]